MNLKQSNSLVAGNEMIPREFYTHLGIKYGEILEIKR